MANGVFQSGLVFNSLTSKPPVDPPARPGRERPGTEIEGDAIGAFCVGDPKRLPLDKPPCSDLMAQLIASWTRSDPDGGATVGLRDHGLPVGTRAARSGSVWDSSCHEPRI